MTKTIIVKVVDLYLDIENPRIGDQIVDQNDAIEQLIKREDIKNLAKDIAENGLSDFEKFGVMKDEEQNGYTVLEGNRRTCALILLTNPDRAPKGQQAFFRKLSSSQKIPKTVDAVLYDKREDSKLWIERRHLGYQSGLGVKDWNAEQQTVYQQRIGGKTRNSLSLALLNRARDMELGDSNEKGVITTVTRYISNPIFRQAMGVANKLTDNWLEINIPVKNFDEKLKYFLSELYEDRKKPASKRSVSSRSNQSDINRYASQLALVSPAMTSGETITLDDQISLYSDLSPEDKNQNTIRVPEPEDKNQNTAPATSPTPAPVINNNVQATQDHSAINIENNDNQNNAISDSPQNTPTLDSTVPSDNTNNSIRGINNPDKRMYLFGSQFKPVIKDANLKRLINNEIKKIPVDDSPLAAAFLFRCFLENTITLYCEKVGAGHQGDMANKMRRGTQYISDNLEELNLNSRQAQALGALKKIPDNTSHILNPKNLGMIVHTAAYPDPLSLRREWDNIQYIIEYMLNEVAK